MQKIIPSNYYKECTGSTPIFKVSYYVIWHSHYLRNRGSSDGLYTNHGCESTRMEEEMVTKMERNFYTISYLKFVKTASNSWCDTYY